jgi:endonuclease YncB( thermonuclease family)
VRAGVGVALGLVFGLAQAGAEVTQAPAWTDRPVKVDREAQSYERLEARPAPRQEPDPFTLRFTGKSRYAIIDSVTFEEGGRRYHLVGLDPVPSGQICTDAAGGRWACGLRARAALGGLITGRPLRCAPRGSIGEVVEVECRREGRDLGEALVGAGNAFVAPGADRYAEVERKARDEKVGIWSDPPAAH